MLLIIVILIKIISDNHLYKKNQTLLKNIIYALGWHLVKKYTRMKNITPCVNFGRSAHQDGMIFDITPKL